MGMIRVMATRWFALTRGTLPRGVLVLIILAAWVGAPSAQTLRGKPVDTAVKVEAASDVPAERSTPRATMLTFLEAMDDWAGGPSGRKADAVACLELNALIEERGEEVAQDLKEVIDRIGLVQRRNIPNKATGEPFELGRVLDDETEDIVGRIVIARQDDGQWLFTSETVESAARMFLEVRHMPRLTGTETLGFRADRWLRSWIPEMLQKPGLLLEHWQWIGLALLVFFGLLLDRLFLLVLGFITGRLLAKEHLAVRRETTRKSLRPFGFVVMAAFWGTAIRWLALPGDAYLWLKVVIEFVVAIGAVWGAYRLVDLAGEAAEQWARTTEGTFDDLLIPLLTKTAKLLVAVAGIVFLANQLKQDITGVLAGLGLAGMAVALAAQDFIKNVFGSVMVLADRTFQVGDWVIIDDVEGSIERVGFRSTKVRTFYNSVITLPNSRFITASVDNLGMRRYRRWKTNLALTYDTPPARIEAFCEGVRELVRRHPYTRKDYFQVYLNGFNDSSLDVLLYVFFECPDWNTELRERHRLMLDILRMARSLGVDFAFPTQTLHLESVAAQAAPDEPSRDPALPEPIDEPAPYASQRDVSQASLRGRAAAREIISAFDLDKDKPPPVRIDLATHEAFGESDS